MESSKRSHCLSALVFISMWSSRGDEKGIIILRSEHLFGSGAKRITFYTPLNQGKTVHGAQGK